MTFESESAPSGGLRLTLGRILGEYEGARRNDPLGAQHPIWRLFAHTEDLLKGSAPLSAHPTVKVKWSVGQGRWANVPWVAFLDERETATTQEGLYPVLLFRQDGSAVYLAVVQGVTRPKASLGTAAGLELVRARAQELRPTFSALAAHGFQLDGDIDLRSDDPRLGSAYEAATVAHKRYDSSELPADELLERDLAAVLEAYDLYFEHSAGAEAPALKDAHESADDESEVSTSPIAQQYNLRERLLEGLERELIGPAESDELIAEPPITRYITGVLYPQTPDPVSPEQDLDLAEDYDEITRPEPTVAMANTRYPSTMALTFAVSDPCPSLEVRISVATYTAPDDGDEHEDVDIPRGWRRKPLDLQPVQVPLEQGVRRTPLAEGLDLFVNVRQPGPDGNRAVTIALTNLLTGTGLRDEISFFQPSIRVRDVAGGTPFRERTPKVFGSTDRDLRSYRLLYRNAKAFAVGHGCAVGWDAEGDVAREVWTTFVPRHAVPVVETNPAIESPVLELRRLAKARKDEVIDGLSELCSSYKTWLDEQRLEASELEEAELRTIADEHLSECDEVVRRMSLGVEVLREESDAWAAFRLMNEAMLEQRARSAWLAAGRPEAGPSYDESHRWRPFQLGFVLLCLPGLVRGGEEREIADLLWFPTAGGKTEAYLGLIAFTLFLRRLSVVEGEGHGGGVTVLMRYTLRLLTLQQFERAALLICACEAIRRREASLGGAEISIGLWVGEAATPNSLQDTRVALDRLGLGEELEEGSPVQLRRCPWCGTALGRRNHFIGDRRRQLIVSCRTSGCEFRDRLPTLVVDEDIYRWRPSLIIATADKFAQLPWNDEIRALFNLGTKDPPPELIIQDELHLISGPLGTLAGLYETAVDVLCSEGGATPKIVASTATIRRARDQGRALFGREMRQFPPPVLDQGDSWFAVEAPPDRRGTRLYVGAIAPGTSHATLLIRVYAALLQTAQAIEADAPTKDPYWTLVGYFNSLRVLGGARIQVQDDVRDRIGAIAGEHPARSIDHIVELTSREPSSRIPEHLRDMAVSLPDERTIDVILATNMISVGVDIDRLGLMAVMGQPQATAEYIQATSRVGRRFPGLIVTLFNAARSRDRSHYEAFVAYHSALYRQVESTSVTPFSSRARERGLHAILVALARLLEPAFFGNDGAAAAAEHRAVLESVRDRIIERVRVVDPAEEDQTFRELNDVIRFWVARAEERPDLCYSQPYDPERALLSRATGTDPDFDELPTLNSLRDVDQVSELYVVR